MTHTTNNRRREPRSLTSALVLLTASNGEMTGVLEDLSPSGASVYVERDLPIGSQVSLTVGDITCAGSIRHREACDDSFYIGIQFQDGKWPKPVGRVIHSIDE